MGLGTFCTTKNHKLETIQPNNLRITGIQSGFLQYLEIYQSIQTTEDLDEVSYIFPTDNKICVYGMTFHVGDETIEAELRSNKIADQTFKEAKRTGRTAAITKEESPGITSIKIGNVPKEKELSIIFQCAITTNLSNRKTILTKIPLQAIEPDGSPLDLYSLPSLKIDVNISITQAQPISKVYANCESCYEKVDDKNGKLKIENPIFTDENLIILTEFIDPVESQIVQDKSAALISVIPDFEAEKSDNKEFVFLVDCSASMLGESIRKAKESLNLFISKLSDSSYFNIICFGTKFVKLFQDSEKKTVSTIGKAKIFIEKIRANLGGTEMLQMLTDVFGKHVKTGGQRQIFLVTDGEVYEREKVVQKVEENNGFNRIFAIGLGHGADAGFLDEITEMTKGKSDFVFNKDELPNKVNEHFELSLADSATDVEIHIEGNNSFQTVPHPLNPLLPHVVSHIFVSSNSPVENVMISGKLKENEIENIISNKLELQEIKNENGKLNKSPIFALFAQKQLKKIENDEEKSVNLSLSSGVLSKYTSYIAISDKTYVNKESMESINVSSSDSYSKEDDFLFRRTRCKRGSYRACRSRGRRIHVMKCAEKASDDSDDSEDEEEKEYSFRKSITSRKSSSKKCISKKTKKPMTKKKSKPILRDYSDEKFSDDIEVDGSKPKVKEAMDEEICDKDKSDSTSEEEKYILKPICKAKRTMAKKKACSKTSKKSKPILRDYSDKIFSDDIEVDGSMPEVEEAMDEEICDKDKSDSTSEEEKYIPKRICKAKRTMTKKKACYKHKLSPEINKECEKDRPKMFSFEDEEIVKIDESKIWNDSASAVDIVRHQARDGFWDLPSSFVSKKINGKSLDIGIHLEDSPIIKKRVISTVFALGYLSKFHSEDENKWKFAMEKALKWLEKINSTLNWRELITNNMNLISK